MITRGSNWPFAPRRWPVFYGRTVLAAGTLGVLMSVPGQTMGVSVFTEPLLEALAMTPRPAAESNSRPCLPSSCRAV